MSEVEILNFTSKALLLVLILSLPTIIVAALIGTLVSLLQAITQIQEQTLSFAIKLISVIATIFATARWTGMELYNYTLVIMNMIS